MNEPSPKSPSRLTWFILGLFAAIAGFLLLFEHRAHINSDWILLGLLALCIFGHSFMHRHDRH